MSSRKITLAELEQHGGQNGSYWTAIHGKVYDFSSFVNVHPGGTKIIKLAAGRCVHIRIHIYIYSYSYSYNYS